MLWAFSQQENNSFASTSRVHTSEAGRGIAALSAKSESTGTRRLAVTRSNFAYWEIFKHFGSFLSWVPKHQAKGSLQGRWQPGACGSDSANPQSDLLKTCVSHGLPGHAQTSREGWGPWARSHAESVFSTDTVKTELLLFWDVLDTKGTDSRDPLFFKVKLN